MGSSTVEITLPSCPNLGWECLIPGDSQWVVADHSWDRMGPCMSGFLLLRQSLKWGTAKGCFPGIPSMRGNKPFILQRGSGQCITALTTAHPLFRSDLLGAFLGAVPSGVSMPLSWGKQKRKVRGTPLLPFSSLMDSRSYSFIDHLVSFSCCWSRSDALSSFLNTRWNLWVPVNLWLNAFLVLTSEALLVLKCFINLIMCLCLTHVRQYLVCLNNL